ncbi:uncharacterized protein BCR38DRAFT_351961, partial [Pseudomassariella vexata]
IHFATPFNFSPDPNKVIPQAVEGILSLLRAAAREPSVKRFVYNSSVGAAYSPKGGVPVTVMEDSWNDAALEKAWAPPPYEPKRAPYVYAASKVETERAMFKFFGDENPGFSAKSVNPFLNRNIYNGEPGFSGFMPPGNMPRQCPRWCNFHVAAALDPNNKGERLLAWAGLFNVNMVLDIPRRRHSDRKFIDDLPPQKPCLSIIGDESRLFGVLKKWGGRDSWISLEQGPRRDES